MSEGQGKVSDWISDKYNRLAMGMDEEKGYWQEPIKYLILKIQYVQGKEKIPAQGNPKNRTIFANITEEGIQLRTVHSEQQTILEEQQRYEEILRQSSLEDFVEFEDIAKVDKKVHGEQKHCIIGIFGSRKEVDESRPWIVVRLVSQKIMDECYEQISAKLNYEKQYLKKSLVNYVGIEENIRKIIEKILLSSPGKREVYTRISEKIREKKVRLTREQNKMMMYALMGNHPDIQNLIRKEKIEAYYLEKRKYDELLKLENATIMTDVAEAASGLIVEGYSEKRKMDGIISKRRPQKEEKDSLHSRNFEELYIEKVPYREEQEIDELIGIQKGMQMMEIEGPEGSKRSEPSIEYKAERVKIPVRDYSIICKQPQWYHSSYPGQIEELDLVLKTGIEAVKFMYQLMKANTVERRRSQLAEGPLDAVLDCLKDILTECEYKEDEGRKEKRPIENKSVMELLIKASKNYLEYRKNPNKFY